jgi:CARDB
MKRIAIIAVVALACLTSVSPAGTPTRRADLSLAAASEPPRKLNPGESFRYSFTVINEGRATAGASALRVYLSTDQNAGGDILLSGSQNVDSLRVGRQQTRSRTFVVPANTPRGFYHVLGCADDLRRVRESDEVNCRASSQRLGIPFSERGPVGANGANGPNGPNGPGLDTRRFGRTQLDLGRATVNLAQFPNAHSGVVDFDFCGGSDECNFTADGPPDEGSTQTTQLVKVGPVRLEALCRKTTNGDLGYDPDGQSSGNPPNNGDPNSPPDDTAGGRNYFDEDGDEAKILVYADNGTMNFRGLNGLRWNVPGGTGTPGNDDETGGEGKHQLLAVMRDPNPNTSTDDDLEFRYAFKSTSTTIVHSSGTTLIVQAWAGIDVLGIGDKCAFGGLVEVVQG